MEEILPAAIPLFLFPRFFPVVARIAEASIVVPDFSYQPSSITRSHCLTRWGLIQDGSMARVGDAKWSYGRRQGWFGGMFLNHPGHQVFVLFRMFEMILSKC